MSASAISKILEWPNNVTLNSFPETERRINILYYGREKMIDQLTAFDRRFDRIDDKLGNHDRRFDDIESHLLEHDERFEKIDERFDKLETHFDEKFEMLDFKINAVINLLKK